MTRPFLGELEQLLLLSLARLGSEAYGAEIQNELEERAGRRVSISTIYVTLVRLEDKGFVRSRRADPTPVRGGKSKRYFRLTPRGVSALERSREVLQRMWEGLPDASRSR